MQKEVPVQHIDQRPTIVTMLSAREVIDANQAWTNDAAIPLHTACYHGHTEIVTMLLAHNEIDVNQARTDEGLTPLHCAAFNGHLATAQLLSVYGASLTAVDSMGDTPAQVAATDGQPVLSEWLTAVAGWSPLRIAAGCRLHKDTALLLRQGRIDPDDPATTSIQDMMQVVATSQAKPSALLWSNAPPICKTTTKLMADATRGWHRTTHWLHHAGVRKVVVAVLVVAHRLERGVALSALPSSAAATSEEPSSISKPPAGRLTRAAAAATATAAVEATVRTPLPVLPIEIWMYSMRFVKRSWWLC